MGALLFRGGQSGLGSGGGLQGTLVNDNVFPQTTGVPQA